MNIKMHITRALCTHRAVAVCEYCYFPVFEYIIVFEKAMKYLLSLSYPVAVSEVLQHCCSVAFGEIRWGLLNAKGFLL